jgi:hypothetical protein
MNKSGPVDDFKGGACLHAKGKLFEDRQMQNGALLRTTLSIPGSARSLMVRYGSSHANERIRVAILAEQAADHVLVRDWSENVTSASLRNWIPSKRCVLLLYSSADENCQNFGRTWRLLFSDINLSEHLHVGLQLFTLQSAALAFQCCWTGDLTTSLLKTDWMQCAWRQLVIFRKILWTGCQHPLTQVHLKG